MDTLIVFLVALAAFAGGIVAALLGWLGNSDPFNAKAFLWSVVRSLVAAVGTAVAFNYASILPPMAYLVAFLTGTGVEVGLKRAAKAAVVAYTHMK